MSISIVFICGSLEPGCDGVGDYTRRLAGELIRQGVSAGVVAVYDWHVSDLQSCTQESEGIWMPILRIPFHWPANLRSNRAKEWIDAFDPVWLSLQYVPFAFHPKGVPIGISNFLKNLEAGRNWHVMFHELWVGMPSHASVKEILWGWIQRLIIKTVVHRLKPKVIHTQSWLYQQQLLKLGYEAELLPLFSNIPLRPQRSKKFRSGHLDKEQSDTVKMVVFGLIQPYSHIGPLVKEAVLFSRRRNIKVILQAVGRCGPELERWVSICNSAGLCIDVAGEQAPDCISEILKSASIGITTTALPLVQKSGTVAAMREHGLPVICISRSWLPRGMETIEPPAGIFRLSENVIEKCLAATLDTSPTPGVSEVKQLLLEKLEFA